jgi:hypothetical protein
MLVKNTNMGEKFYLNGALALAKESTSLAKAKAPNQTC